MSVVKQQHYVPQFYLRNFGNLDGRIWAYDKVQDRAFFTHIKNVAGENYFYDVPNLDKLTGKSQFIEHFLHPIEQKSSEILTSLLTKLRTNGFIRLYRNQRKFLSIFLVVQMLRTKEGRIIHQQTARLMSIFLKQSLSEEEIEKHFGRDVLMPSDASIADAQARELINIPAIEEMAKILNSHIWQIYKAKRGKVFLTSDNPFSRRAYVTSPYRSFSGIRSPGIEIVLPISPDYCLCLAERTYFKMFEKRDGKLVELNMDENMVYYNYHQIKSSTRYLFSNVDDFEFVRQVCQEEPIWKDPSRKRITSNHDTPGDTVPGS